MTLSNYVNQEFADKAAISLSGLCLLHCLALPILVAIYPVAFAVSLSEEFFHWAMVMMAIPISIASLFIGCQKHKKRQVLLLGGIALVLLSTPFAIPHEAINEQMEVLVTALGASLLATAHIINFRSCRAAECCDGGGQPSLG